MSSGYVAMLVGIRQRRERESDFGSAVSIVCVSLWLEMRAKETASIPRTLVVLFPVSLFGKTIATDKSTTTTAKSTTATDKVIS